MRRTYWVVLLLLVLSGCAEVINKIDEERTDTFLALRDGKSVSYTDYYELRMSIGVSEISPGGVHILRCLSKRGISVTPQELFTVVQSKELQVSLPKLEVHAEKK